MRNGLRFFILLGILAAIGCGGAANDPKGNRGTNANITPSSPTTPSGAETRKQAASAVETVTFDSAGGARIAGSFYPSVKTNSPAILMLHQWESDRHSFDDLAKQLQARGFSVLTIDGRGFGESVKTADGKPVEPSRSNDAVEGMKADVKAAFEFLSKQPSVNPARTGIIGASYGSSLAVIHAADDHNVKAIALLSPGLNYFGNMPTEPAVRKYGNRPMLLVAAEDDKESASSVKKLKEAGASDTHEVKIYKQGGHGTSLFGAKVGLEELIEEFFKKTLSE